MYVNEVLGDLSVWTFNMDAMADVTSGGVDLKVTADNGVWTDTNDTETAVRQSLNRIARLRTQSLILVYEKSTR